MKKHLIKLFLFVLVSVSFTIGTTLGQSISIEQTKKKAYAQVKKGERPQLDLSKINKDYYENGILKIKFKPEYTKHLDNADIGFNDKGDLVFGISETDKLNKKFKAQKSELVFGSPALNNNFKDRHRLWEFHLWYRLEFDESVDIIKLIEEYSKLAEIEVAEPEYKKVLIDGSKIKKANNSKWTPDDTHYEDQWHYNNTGQSGGTVDCDIDLPEAWDIETGSSDVVVAVIDGGIKYNHTDLAANMWPGNGYNFVNGNSTILPGNHATHIAGTISGVNNNSTGICGIAGGNGSGNGVRLMSCQIFHGGSSAGFDEAPIWAADNGACISQNSWAYLPVGYYEQSALDAIDYFNANGGGSLLNGGVSVFAAANYNSDDDWYPACYSGTFAVAATTHTDEKASYSNYADWVNISAPGGETAVNQTEGILSTGLNTYKWYHGTSMACPHVSGVAALIVSYAYKNNVILNNSDVADILENTTDDHYAQNPDYIGKLGAGRLNAYQALLETQFYFIIVVNPNSLVATPASTSQIDLNWTQNNNGDDVLVAWSVDGTFGTPVDGTSYSAGDVIPGGGQLLYAGNGFFYNHTGLNEGQTYYYKAWSVNSSDEYSVGITANATTNTITSFQDLDEYGSSIYPNPSSGSFNIIFNNSVEDASYIIIDMTGKVIDEDKLTETKNIINLGSIHTGLYFIELIFDNQSVVKKIIIK